MDDAMPTDDAFEDRIRRALGDPIPDEVISRSVAVGQWFAMDEAIAELTHRTLADATAAGVRGDDRVATFTFETDDLTVELEVEIGARVVTGQLLPATRATVRLLSPSETLDTATADGQGVFQLSVVPSGPFSIVVRRKDSDTPVVRTEWTSL